ncbi:MAG: radical SAM protein [Candidatus Hodarchaeales archaeon]|jgi:radical SAM protein with 4Fe4S-binding SPASM domain
MKRAIIWDITHRCNLRCTFCYSGDKANHHFKELSPETILDRVLPKFDELGVDSVSFSGGEPVLKWDLVLWLTEEFAKREYEYLVLCTNATLLTREMLVDWKGSARGVRDLALALPLDSLDADRMKELRPSSKQFDVLKKVKKAINIANDLDLWIFLETVVTSRNRDEIQRISEFARSKGKKLFSEIYPCYLEGRANENKDLLLTTGQLREFDNWHLSNLSKDNLFWDFMPFPVNPSYWEKIRDKALAMGWSEGCPAVNHYLQVDADGTVYPCSFLRIPLGNLVTDPVDKILSHPLARSIANREIKGKCGECKYRVICGGCRARAFTETGDPLGEIPSCEGGPNGHPLEELFTKEVQKSFNRYRRLYWLSGIKQKLTKFHLS